MTKGKTTALDELLGDPMVKMVMERDGVRADELRGMLERASRRGDENAIVPPAHVIAARQARSLCC